MSHPHPAPPGPGPLQGPGLEESEGRYPLYCRALRMLALEGKSLKKVRRTVCWQHLQALHECRPDRYREPAALYRMLLQQSAPSAAPAVPGVRSGPDGPTARA